MALPSLRRPGWLAKLNLGLAIAMPLASQAYKVAGRRAAPERQRARRVQGPATPTGPAFAIWGPLFAVNVGHAALRALRDRRGDVAFRRLGWLTSAAYAFNIAWSVNAQLDRLGWRSVMLIGAGTATSLAAASAAAAYDRQWRSDAGDREARWVSNAMAPLAGWLTVATFSNVEAALNTTQPRPRRDAETRRAVGLVAAASVAAAAGAVATRGHPLYGAAAAWGLAGVVAKNRVARPAVAQAAGVGLLVLAAATFAGGRRR